MRSTSDAEVQATARLAAFVAAVNYEEMPAEAREHAKLITADTIGVALRGSLEPEVRQLHSRLPAGSGSTVFRAGLPRYEPLWAAFANATGACFLELDEGSRPSGHPGIHVVPSALALAQQLGCSGREYLAAMAAGYEVQARIGRATRLRRPVHPHGNMGNGGAVAALGRLSGWSAEQMRHGINAAAGLATATSWQPCFVGATVRNSYPGLTAQTAFSVKLLVDSGFTGYDGAVAEMFGEILGDRFELEALCSGLGQRFAVQDNYFKFHAACALNHPVLDALADALGAGVRSGEYPPMPAADLPAPEQVRRVRVRVPQHFTRLAVVAQRNQLASKFSIPYAVAAYLWRGRSDPDSFRGEALTNSRVRELESRVEVVGDPSLTARWPVNSSSEVDVELEDGRVLRGVCSDPFGSAQNRPSPEDVRAKFMTITEGVMGRTEREALWNACLDLESQPDMSRFALPSAE